MAIVVERRFRGPTGSGNGDYSAGLFARPFGGDEVEVTLRLPPPLETPLDLGADGSIRHGDAVVAEVRPGNVGIAPPVSRAALSASGELLGVARALWIEPRP